MPAFARKCWARSSIPFWQKRTVAPDFLTWSTIRRRTLSSSARNAWSWLGSVISIFASISVFLTSRAASTIAIFALSTCCGIPGWTRSLSTITPSTSCVSLIEPPCFFVIWMLSSSTNSLPSRSSATSDAALTATSPRRSEWELAALLDVDLLQDRDAVVRDHDVPEAVDEHLVHPARPERRAHGVRHRFGGGDVVELCAFAAVPSGSFLQYENRCSTCRHHCQIPRLLGHSRCALLYKVFGRGPSHGGGGASFLRRRRRRTMRITNAIAATSAMSPRTSPDETPGGASTSTVADALAEPPPPVAVTTTCPCPPCVAVNRPDPSTSPTPPSARHRDRAVGTEFPFASKAEAENDATPPSARCALGGVITTRATFPGVTVTCAVPGNSLSAVAVTVQSPTRYGVNNPATIVPLSTDHAKPEKGTGVPARSFPTAWNC